MSVLMLHNVYGTPTDYSAGTSQVIPSLVRKAVRYPEEQFVVWGDGSQRRRMGRRLQRNLANVVA